MINKVLHLLFLCTFASPLVMGCGTNAAEIPAGPIGEAPAVEEPDARHIYLWDEGKMPMITEYTVNNGNYQDNPDFRPNIVWYPVPEGTAVKGAVMVCPGGAFMFRSGNEDSFYRQFNQNVEAVRQTGVLMESHVLEGWPYGFGVRGEWTTWFDNFLTEVMTNGASSVTNSTRVSALISAATRRQDVLQWLYIPLLPFLLAQLFFQKPDASGQFFNRRQLVLNFPNPDIVV